MDEKTREYFILWSETKQFYDKIVRTERFLKSLGEMDGIYVACSGGKDSMVLLHLADKCIDSFDIFHWDHGVYLIPRKIEREIQRNIRQIASGRRLIIASSPRLNNIDIRWNYKIWYYCFHGILRKLIEKYGWKIGLLGFRSEESIKRRFRTRRKYEIDSHGVKLYYPISKWSWRDIWAYIVKNNIPYPSIYDRYASLIGWDKARLVTFFDREFNHLGNQIDGYLMWRYKNL